MAISTWGRTGSGLASPSVRSPLFSPPNSTLFYSRVGLIFPGVASIHTLAFFINDDKGRVSWAAARVFGITPPLHSPLTRAQCLPHSPHHHGWGKARINRPDPWCCYSTASFPPLELGGSLPLLLRGLLVLAPFTALPSWAGFLFSGLVPLPISFWCPLFLGADGSIWKCNGSHWGALMGSASDFVNFSDSWAWAGSLDAIMV